MAFKDVTIGTTDYKLPISGSNPPWGEELSAIIEALIDSVNTVQGPYDIQETSATLSNITGDTNIVGLAFDSSHVRSSEISYNVSRSITKTISTIPTGTGTIQIDFATAHDLYTGDKFTIAGSNSTPSIDGTYTVLSKVDSDSVTIDIASTVVSVAGTTGTASVELVESGIMFINYGQQAWSFSQERIGDADIELDINASGQMIYNVVALTGTSYSGTMKFIAKALISS